MNMGDKNHIGKKMRTIDKSIYIIFLIISIYALAISPTASKLTNSGSIFNINAAPGEHISHNLTVSLSSDEPSPINIQVDLQDWYQSPTGANIDTKNNSDLAPYSAKKFLTISPRTFSLAPGKSQDVKIEGIMPSGDGGRYAIVSVHTVPNRAKKGVSISFGLNALVLLIIKDSNLSATGEIENLSIAKPISSTKQNVTMIFHNTGNYHYGIGATVTLKGEKGNTLATATPDIRGAIIPTARRTIKVSLSPESELKPGNYTISAEVDLDDGTILATKELKLEIK